MRAQFEITDGRERLKRIVASFPPASAHWNEAQNRFQFIDRLLTECMGWEKPHIRVESTDEAGGRADYLLGSPPRAVVEAKKEALIWNTLPTGDASKVRKLRPLLEASKEFREVVHQVIPYCSIRGVPIAVVCNGPQLAIMQAILIGQSPLDGECYFFNGFQSYIDDFTLLWTLLSPEGVVENRALRELSRHRTPRIPAKASQAIPEPNRYRYRDPVQEELRQLGSLLLEEIEDNPDLRAEFFTECYVPIEANNRHLLLSKQIIGARYKRVGVDNIAPASLDSATQSGQLSDSFTTGAGSRPIIVVGDVGVGKSSFFENLYLKISKQDRVNTYFITVNLGIKATLTADLKTFVLELIPTVLRQKYGVDIFDRDFVQAAYHEELKAFDRTTDGALKGVDDTEYLRARIKFLNSKTAKIDAHLLAALAHIAHGRKKRIILVLDNADQRSFSIQQEAFLIAQELAATRNLFVFVALRPSTFYLSKTTGALAAYQNKLLTISPPPADIVIEKRIAFALRVAEGQAAPAALEGIKLNLKRMVEFLRATLRSVRTNDEIRQFLSNITGGNTRAVIELITTFCGSPNVEAKKIIELEETRGNYLVPLHEFTKHALLGDYAYFNPHSSLVACNIFDVTSADPREHFLCALIVGYISSNLGTRDNDGFVHGAAIVAEMLKLNFLEDQTLSAIYRLASKRLIETPHAHYREVPLADGENPENLYFRATTVGIYHVRFWAGSFAFIDATSTDTPIFDENVRQTVAEAASSFEIKSRWKRATAFRDYLDAQWRVANIETTYFNFTTLVDGQTRSFELVENVVKGRTRYSSSSSHPTGRPARTSAPRSRKRP